MNNTQLGGGAVSSHGQCAECDATTRERGNGEENYCHLHDPVRQLGARVLEILHAVNRLSVQICEYPEGWLVSCEGSETMYDSATEAARAVRDMGTRYAPSVVVVTWNPTTWVGRAVLRAIGVDDRSGEATP